MAMLLDGMELEVIEAALRRAATAGAVLLPGKSWRSILAFFAEFV